MPRPKSNGLPSAGDRDLKFILADKSRPANYLFPSEHLVFDPVSKKQRTARYVQGVPDIWKDKQPKDVTRTAIHFVDGDLFVPKDDTSLQEFMLSIMNEKGDMCTFKIDNPEEEAKVSNEKRRLISQATGLIASKETKPSGKEELLTVARYYGIDTSSFELVLQALWTIAEKEPEKFIDCFNNPSVKMKSLMAQGKDIGLFLFDDDTQVKNARTGDPICHVPMGVDPMDALTSHALSSKGKMLIEYVENEIK